MAAGTSNVTLITASQACELQNNSINGQETASQATAESILSYINTQIKTNANINRDYCDIAWTSIKSNQSTEVILTWINLTPENTEEEHYTGIQTKVGDKYTNQWVASVGNALIDANMGYRWCFLYYRDNEQPYGIRVCWRPADYYPTPTEGENPTDPIALARIEHQYIILPKIKLTLPPADEVEIIHVEQQEIIQTNNSLQQLFSSINHAIQERAEQGFNYAFIPWSTLGNQHDMQSLFFEKSENYITIVEKSDKENEELTGINSTNLYGYGAFDGGYYSTDSRRGVHFKSFSTADYDIGIFDDSTYTNNDYFVPNAEHDFTVYDLITNANYLGYGLSFYAALDTTNISNGYSPYCEGICIAWGMDPSEASQFAINKAQINYDQLRNDYELEHAVTYDTLDSPTFADFEASCRKNNSAYLQALVTAIKSKMNAAFAKNERAVYVLWSDISSNLPKQAYNAWLNNNAMYDGTFPAMHEGGNQLYEDYVGSLSSAFNIISKGTYYSISEDFDYMWAYCWYNKNGTEAFAITPGSTSIQEWNIDERAPAGIVIALYGHLDDNSGYTAQQQTAAAITKVQAEVFAIVDPAYSKPVH